ncbi:probable hexosyltransferase MUCI70 [Amaranthus tricolor]|uniref:probable hexosyltransferase MUCI70 n=1 Tax=Amaranthus tricolor TaxID=29722 RepID=UPI00258F5F41|nr:probable hexosyltransferase MUCI70 [Amaranthus tricolor]XP_057538428.1 probable hexosyltransferase MUCI70 [Amaranthus tricolor]
MSGGSLGLGLRSASYGSLQQQLQNNLLQNQLSSPLPPPPPFSTRKPVKMMKDKERLFHWLCKTVGRKKVGMLFLCLVSAAVFIWVLYVGKGEDSRGNEGPASITINNRTSASVAHLSAPLNNSTRASDEPLPARAVQVVDRKYFTGYTLPPGNPCQHFALPPPPADPKRTGPRPCPVCYLDQKQAIALMPDAPSYSPVYNLTYVYEENSSKTEFGGSEFGGYPSLKQRDDSYDVRESMIVHCGFVKGQKPGRGTGFDIDDADLAEMEQCKGLVVASAIFGNYDLLQQPKNTSEDAKRNVCFFMFLDEETEAAMKNASVLDGSKRVGLWRIVIVRNLPYTDPRRNGKVPKLLLHRLFPNVRYSIWMDGKLELVEDPYRILERFLWRQNATFAISRHYKRFDVFEEAEANKVAAKYDNASIDFQINFYKKEGLTPYSVAKLPITSDVPEGCVIIREHVPISDLFSCLWFNEVDRFTSRDQISFSTVRDKIRKKANWTVSMFLDCERRNFVNQGYHMDVLKQKQKQAEVLAAARPPPVAFPPPPPVLAPPPPPTQVEGPPTRRNRGRGRRRNRKVAAGAADETSIGRQSGTS